MRHLNIYIFLLTIFSLELSAVDPGVLRKNLAAKKTVASSSLQDVDMGWLGLYDSFHTKVPADIWKNSTYEEIEKLLKSLPHSFESPVAWSLFKRVLLTNAEPPSGKKSKSFHFVRLDSLLKLGELSTTIKLADLLEREEKVNHDDVNYLRYTLYLIKGDVPHANRIAERSIQLNLIPRWMEAQVLRHFYQGHTDKAKMTLDLMREDPKHTVENELFYKLAEAIIDNKKIDLSKIEPLKPLTVVNFYLIKMLKAKIPDNLIESHIPLLLKRMIYLEHMNYDLRLITAEESALAGAIPPVELADIYDSRPTTVAEIKKLESDLVKLGKAPSKDLKESINTPRSRAILYHLMKQDPVKGISKFYYLLEAGYPESVLNIFARAVQPISKPLLPKRILSLGEYRYKLAFLFLRMGDLDLARAWAAYARYEHPDDSILLTPLLQLASMKEEVGWNDKKTLIGWYKHQQRLDPKTAKYKATVLFTFLAILGETVDPEAWKLIGLRPIEKEHLGFSPVEKLVRQKKVGEAVLKALGTMGHFWPYKTTFPEARSVIRALMHMGFTEEARALALEYLLAQGL